MHLRTFITFTAHSSKLHSFLWMWTLRPHFWAKMFDFGDLPVLTFGKIFSVLKTGVIKWPLKLYGLFYVFNVFFQNPKTSLFMFFELLHTFSRTLARSNRETDSQMQLSGWLLFLSSFVLASYATSSEFYKSGVCNRTKTTAPMAATVSRRRMNSADDGRIIVSH